jgi:hypothetical protein
VAALSGCERASDHSALTHRFVVERLCCGEDFGRDDRSCMDSPARTPQDPWRPVTARSPDQGSAAVAPRPPHRCRGLRPGGTFSAVSGTLLIRGQRGAGPHRLNGRWPGRGEMCGRLRHAYGGRRDHRHPPSLIGVDGRVSVFRGALRTIRLCAVCRVAYPRGVTL